MDRERYHRFMFILAAIWNWLLGASFLIMPRIDINYFFLAGGTIPPTLLWFDSFMALVFVFGIGFYFVSQSTQENHGLIKMAIVEKILVFIIPFYYFLLAQATLLVVIFVAVDLLFGILFIEDLLAIRKL